MRQRKSREYLGQSVPAERTSSAKPPEVGFFFFKGIIGSVGYSQAER